MTTMQNGLNSKMYGGYGGYGSHVRQTEYKDMTTATDLKQTIAPPTETPAKRRARWAHMTPEQIMQATPENDLIKFARRGAKMAIEELATRRRKFPRPDPELNIGV
jgi:hypothetical protein